MLVAWTPGAKGLAKSQVSGSAIPAEAIWIDCIDITPEEEKLLEATLHLDMPTRAEMQEIEASSRLYRDGGAVYMTATMLSKTATEQPESAPVTFILSRSCLVTLRYSEPWTFRTFSARAAKSDANTAELVFISLLETTVERLADMLERDVVPAELVAKLPDPEIIASSVVPNGDQLKAARELIKNEWDNVVGLDIK